MATQALIQPYYVGSTDKSERQFRGGPEHPEVKETASQSFGVGDLIYEDSNGTVAIATVTGTQLSGIVAGIAKKAATGTTGAEVHYPIIRPVDLFMMNVYHATTASAVTAQDQQGTVRGVVKINGKWHIDIENTVEGATDALGRVRLMELPKKNIDGTTNALGDTYGLWVVQFLSFSFASDSVPFARTLQFA